MMNKKGQNFNFNNPNDWPGIILWAFVVLIVLGALSTAFYQFNKSLNCGDEIRERDTCCSNASYWKGQYDAMNESIANCSNLIQEQIDKCDDRVNESVNNCMTTLELYQNYVVVNKIFFAVYHILVIFLYIPLTINLFKITFEIGLGEKWDKLKKWYKRTLLITKIVVWAVLTLTFIRYVLLFLFSNPI